MREIRFRAWDKRGKVMTEPFEFFNASIKVNGNVHVCFKEDMVLMQYTGFTDKTGKEIYEGDVCRASYVCLACFDSDPHILTGEITKDSFGAWMFDFGHGAMAISYLIMDEGSDIEVIGNVCENPELVG